MMKKLMIFMLNFYQKHISKFFTSLGFRCKYYPSCSEYMKQAIEKYGFLKGFLLGIWRVIRCNPFSNGGYDPVK